MRVRTLINEDSAKAAALRRLLNKAAAGPDGCIIWTGDTTRGYGIARSEGRRTGAHRLTYQLLVGPVPEGMVIDHRCHNEDLSCAGGFTCLHRRCINPMHLEPTTSGENVLRGRGLSARNKVKSTCLAGHPLDNENTYVAPGSTARQCKRCKNERKRNRLHDARTADRERMREIRRIERGDGPDCGHVSERGNACTRPVGHDGQHNSKAAPTSQADEALRRARADTPAGACPTCRGRGGHVEDTSDAGVTRKTWRTCDTCRGTGGAR